MKTVGLITEYNPFHNGHRYHIEEAKKITGADRVVVVMSGNFVQRGAPAILNKYARTEIALQNGVDLVIELPVCYATASAEFFALGAIATLDKLGIIDFICFGSESGDITSLSTVADIIQSDPPELNNLIANFMKNGMTFPQARTTALIQYVSTATDTYDIKIKELETLLQSPNNILGIEYIKAIKKLESTMKPITIKRKDSNYHDQELNATFSSATSIRKSFKDGLSPSSLEGAIPKNSFGILEKEYLKTFPILEEDISLILKYKLMLEEKDTFKNYFDVSEELKNRIYNYLSEYTNYCDFAQLIKTKQYTLTRVNRALIHILLNIDSDNFGDTIKNGTVKYARVLGFKKDSSSLIRAMSETGELLPIIKVADAKSRLDIEGQKILDLDIFSSDLYNSIVFQKFGVQIKNDYIHGIIILS